MLEPSEIAAMRETSERAMPDTCTITRAAATGALDTVTGEWDPDAASTVYTGVGRVRPPTANMAEVVFGDRQVTRQRYVGTFPYDAAQILIDDIVTVTASSDDQISGRSFRVATVSSGSFLIDRRVGLEVVE
jgi:hypothetical protein